MIAKKITNLYTNSHMVISYQPGEPMSLDLKKELLAAVKANINVPGLSDAVIDKIAFAALQDAVAKSENKIDDVVLGALGPLLKEELKKQIRALWEKLINGDEPVL